ncbi:MAG: LD-carboxypeptidase [Bacteroidota bacterium]
MKRSRRDFIRTTGLAGLGLPLLGMSSADPKPQQETPGIIKPPALKKGDTIGITCPATAVWNMESIGKFMETLTAMGFKLKIGKTLTEKYGYFAGSDELRAGELNGMIADKSVKAIFCGKGGWGCARLLDSLDYEALKQNPKILLGFSDITSLLIAVYAKTGLVTFHGPVGNSGWNDFSKNWVVEVLMNKQAVSYTYPEKDKDPFHTINPGTAQGVLVGGNLSVLSGIIGSSYLPAWKNKILFLEEAEEEPYSIDRMLTHLKLAGVMKDLSGIIFGKCTKCLAEEPDKAFTLKEVLEMHFKPLGIPAFYGAMIGHIENKYTVPLGIPCEMDAAAGSMKLMEAAVV